VVSHLVEEYRLPQEEVDRVIYKFESERAKLEVKAEAQEQERADSIANKKQIVRVQQQCRWKQAVKHRQELKREKEGLAHLQDNGQPIQLEKLEIGNWHRTFKKDHKACKSCGDESHRNSANFSKPPKYCNHCIADEYSPENFRRNSTVGWLRDMERRQTHDADLFNKNAYMEFGQPIDLGAILPSYAFAYSMSAPFRAVKRSSRSLAFSYENPFCMGILYGRAGRLTAIFGGFRPGQEPG
jgi:hypothetical protein